MTRKSFLTAYFITLVISIASLLLLSWLLIQALNKNSQLNSQHNLLISQLRVAQEAVKRFEKRQESEEDQQREYDDLEDKYLKILSNNQKLESENISQTSKIKELSEFYVKYEETLKAKLSEQRAVLTREHAGRVRKLKMMFKREKLDLSKAYEKQKAALAAELQTREFTETQKRFQEVLSAKLKEQRRALTREQAKRVRELKRSLKRQTGVSLSSAAPNETAALKFQLDDLRAENLRLKEAVKTPHAKKAESAASTAAKKSGEVDVEQLKKENAITRYNLGVVLLRNRKYDDAFKEFKYSLTLNPNDPLTHYNLAYIYEEHFKDFERAIRHYQDYLRLNPDAKDITRVEEQLLRLRIREEVGVDGVLKVGK